MSAEPPPPRTDITANLNDVRSTGVPESYRAHRLIEGKTFFTLPPNLLSQIKKAIGSSTIARDTWEMEIALSDVIGDHSSLVGFSDGIPIAYQYLHWVPAPSITIETAQMLGWDTNQAKLDRAMRLANKRSRWLHEIASGYAGWLVTTPQFCSEQDTHWERWEDRLRPDSRRAVMADLLVDDQTISGDSNVGQDSEENSFQTDVFAFLARWRLMGIAAAGLPIPITPQLSGFIPSSMARQLMQQGAIFSWPDTFPIPAKDELRTIIYDSLNHAAEADAVRGWRRNVSSSNTARSKITRFARIFRLQHFWRAWFSRHSDAMRGKIGAVEEAFAGYFQCSSKAIHTDRGFIASHMARTE